MRLNKKSVLSQFTGLQKIGEGFTSIVYKAYNQKKQYICLKVIDQKFYSKTIGKLLIDNQVQILKQLNHQNLLKFQKYIKTENQNVILTHFCDGGNLYDKIKKSKKISEKQMLIIINGVIKGMNYLFSKKIIHRDLKPENVFFRHGQPLIADFGFAVHLDNNCLNKVNAGSPLYMSPQALKNRQFSIDSDIFALGVLMYEMLMGKTPWKAVTEKELHENILKQKPQINLENKQLEKLILKCLQPSKAKRAKFQEVFQFLTKQQTTNKQNKQNTQLFDSNSIQIPTDKRKLSLKIQKQNKQTKSIYKLPKTLLKANQNKQNFINLSYQISLGMKTNRVISEVQSKNKSFALQSMDALKTQRNNNSKNDKNADISGHMDNRDKDFHSVLTRLDPGQMKFLPSSMIEKFKFILDCYLKIMQKGSTTNKSIHLPIILKDDKSISEIRNCRNQKQLCMSVNGYVGRMYRLAKNYKIYRQFMKDIEILYNRVESFTA